MKRKLSDAETDFAMEADQLLLAQVVAEEDTELGQRAAAAKQAKEDQVLRDRLACDGFWAHFFSIRSSPSDFRQLPQNRTFPLYCTIFFV